MTDQQEGKAGKVEFAFAFSPKPNDHDICIKAVCGTAEVHIDFTDDSRTGTSDMATLYHYWPQIIYKVRQEVSIKREVNTIDSDLRELLGGDGDTV